jgi:hypothetical protein
MRGRLAQHADGRKVDELTRYAMRWPVEEESRRAQSTSTETMPVEPLPRNRVWAERVGSSIPRRLPSGRPFCPH